MARKKPAKRKPLLRNECIIPSMAFPVLQTPNAHDALSTITNSCPPALTLEVLGILRPLRRPLPDSLSFFRRTHSIQLSRSARDPYCFVPPYSGTPYLEFTSVQGTATSPSIINMPSFMTIQSGRTIIRVFS